ncbi:hypothetical protein DBV15_08589 [Temnothorax longispinosus]|uniref:Uncharacterized protein n=1 Tax=Temnothorax longispinosus TaxID=300112 RepID=A0A4S2KUU6_9HYME|nr:hypothetical protein DBV15_08589 [Temnothorax longispinosus]
MSDYTVDEPRRVPSFCFEIVLDRNLDRTTLASANPHSWRPGLFIGAYPECQLNCGTFPVSDITALSFVVRNFSRLSDLITPPNRFDSRLFYKLLREAPSRCVDRPIERNPAPTDVERSGAMRRRRDADPLMRGRGKRAGSDCARKS